MRHLQQSFRHYNTTKEYAEKVEKYNAELKHAFIQDELIAKEKAKPKHRAVRVATNFAKLAEQRNKAYRG